MTLTSPCANTRLFQNSIYAGFNIQEMLYGVELALYLQTMHAILRTTRMRKAQDRFYAIFSTVMLLVTTVWLITQMYFGAQLWVSRSVLICGPTSQDTWYFGCGSVAIIILHLMTDALMMYRCWMTWYMRSVMLVPLFIWIATLTLGVLTAWSSTTHQGNLLLGVASKLSLAYVSVTVFLNALLAGMICYRVIQFGRKLRVHFGRESASLYFWVAALVIESMLPYTLSGIAFLITFGIGSPTSNAFLSVYILLTCLSSQILIFRVHTRQFSNEDKQPVSTIEFAAQTYVRQCPGESSISVNELV